MFVNLGIWLSVFVFSLLIMVFVREALALALMFSSLNAMVASAFELELVYTAVVFLASYVVLLAVILITSAAVKAVTKRACVDNAQKSETK